MTADLHTLAGAYVLHALSPEELAEFERHLSDCDSCALEVRELAATTQRLGAAVATAPPPEMRVRVLRQIATVRQEPPEVPPERAGRVRTRRIGGVIPRLVLAACVAGALLGGGVAAWQYQEARDARDQAQLAERSNDELMGVLTSPDVVVESTGLDDGATGTVLVSAERDRAVFVASGMAEPPAGMVYQLWFDDDGTMRPGGLMDPADGPTGSAVLMDGPVNGAGGMGITLEPAGGSPQPTSDPLLVMAFPEAG
ncbi:anti-sigma factor [Streptomyces spiramenti]|uniref:Regulator of SigK n=1 Tax=Streptomyces spiramenti TaxID=2720606 RepID=A0ABX1ADT5_9ACTN|nr:anti-sigma factor [Streptomyces spiramenti]NJP65377.1 anti-sigma factor [Streptomyces spiramenti]